MQRLRIKFKRGQEIKFISHLDIARLWERAFRRAQIHLAYSEGFNPHPRISLAVPLSVGVTSEAELMDVFINRPIPPERVTAMLKQQLPAGIEIDGVFQIALNVPSLQSQVRFAEYMVELESDKERNELETAISELLSLKQLPWQHQRDTGFRNYDLRPLIDDLWCADWKSCYCTIGMKLGCDNRGSGRPEQVALAMGFSQYPKSIRRTRLFFETRK